MPQIENWSNFPSAVRDHLAERMRDRDISISDLNRLRVWIEARPEVPEGDWYKDFGSFKLCGTGGLSQNFPVRWPACERQGAVTTSKHL
jgi:hypothetical protein